MPLSGDYASLRARWIALRREAREKRGLDRAYRLRAARRIDLIMQEWEWRE